MPNLPKFQSEQEESEFWENHDSTQFFENSEEVDVEFCDTRMKQADVLKSLPSSNFASVAPSRRMTACALYFNEQLELLIVKPTYRPDNDWLLVGGTVECGKVPSAACKREVSEELGINFPIQQSLCIEYQSPKNGDGGSIHFIFYGDILNSAQIQQIKLPEDELSEFRFCEVDSAMKLLSPKLAERLSIALLAIEQKKLIYVEN